MLLLDTSLTKSEESLLLVLDVGVCNNTYEQMRAKSCRVDRCGSIVQASLSYPEQSFHSVLISKISLKGKFDQVLSGCPLSPPVFSAVTSQNVCCATINFSPCARLTEKAEFS